jgi:hypothetical protein
MVLWRVDKIAYGTLNVGRSVVQQRQAKHLAKRKQSVKMMVVCVTLFFLCYAPRNIIFFIVIIKWVLAMHS